MSIFINGNRGGNPVGAALTARDGEPLVLKSVRANGTVTGLLFELAVEQQYMNLSDKNIEAIYTFPLPWGGGLAGYGVHIGREDAERDGGGKVTD